MFEERDIQKKNFVTLTTRQNGRLFIQFLSLILKSSIEYTMIKK